MQMRRRQKPNEKLPPYVYLKKGRYVRVHYDPATQKQREARLCAGTCTVAEVWKAYEGGAVTNDLNGLAKRFEASPAWAALGKGTQRDYQICGRQVCAHKTNIGPMGQVALSDWTPGLVRRYVDRRGETSVSRANHDLRWLKRLFAWAHERDYIARNPARGVKILKQEPRQRYVEDTEYAAVLLRAQVSGSSYLAPIMELAYRCRMRLCEVLDMTDADLTDAGVRVRRRKGSKGNITEWSPGLKAAVEVAKRQRTVLIEDRGLTVTEIDPKKRYLFLSRSGSRLSETTVQTAWQRLMRDDPARFTIHDLKRKGVSDTKGDKLKASGHRSAAMLKVYDVRLDTVPAAGE